jgi:hypothetical protein
MELILILAALVAGALVLRALGEVLLALRLK